MSNEQKHFQSRGTTWSWSNHLGQSNQDSENLSKAKSPGENLRLSHLGHFNNESGLIKHLLVAWQNTSNRGNSLLSENGHSRKILRIIKDPLGWHTQAKIKGFPANQKDSGKNKGWNEKKSVHPASRKPEKAAWAKRVSRWTKNSKWQSRKKLGM